MKKKAYQAPELKVVQVQQMQIICGSIGTEKLTESDFDWGEPEPTSGYSTEKLTESDFTEW